MHFLSFYNFEKSLARRGPKFFNQITDTLWNTLQCVHVVQNLSESMAHLYDTSIFIDCTKCCSYDSLTVFGKRSLEFIGESKGARNVLDI